MLDACALTDTGRIRRSNQDAFRIVPDLGLCVLADGMGGARGGERASSLAVNAIVGVLERAPHCDAATLLGAVEEANRVILAEANGNPHLEGMGTTIVAALETRTNELAIASVGDSRAYLWHGGALRAVTQDQTWVEEMGRGQGMDDETLRKHPMRHVLTMAVGVGPSLRILYYAVELEPGDLMLLTTDGLHGVVPEAAIGKILSGSDCSLQEKCEKLIAAANEAGSPDNVTVVLLRSSFTG